MSAAEHLRRAKRSLMARLRGLPVGFSDSMALADAIDHIAAAQTALKENVR